MDDPLDAARAHVLETHSETLRAVQTCADAVVAEWEGQPPSNGQHVASALERELGRRGVLSAFPELLAGAVAAAGYELLARPVPAPPYVTVTSLGPIARATVRDARFVLSIRVFEIERGERTRYVRHRCEPAEAIVVECR